MDCNDLETFERPFPPAMTALPMQESHHVTCHSSLTPLQVVVRGPRSPVQLVADDSLGTKCLCRMRHGVLVTL
jgi:hypothetical protein